MDDRPGFYVRLEVGLSWPRHAFKHRSITCGSSITKKQHQDVQGSHHPLTAGTPVTAATNACYRSTDNYLRHVYEYAHVGSSWSHHLDGQQPQLGQHEFAHLPEWSNAHASNERDHRNDLTPVAALTPERHESYGPPLAQQPRRSRSMSFSLERQATTSTYIQDRPWDIDPEPLGSTALPARQQVAIPLSQSTWVPAAASPNQSIMNGVALPSASSPPDWAAYTAVETSKRTEAELKTRQGESGGASSVDQSRSVDVQSLATALVTVDNGFEDQWWYQGPRTVTIAGDLISPATLRLIYEQEVVTRMVVPTSNADPLPRLHDTTPASTIVELVSPMSDFSSPISHTRQKTSP